MLAYAVRRVLLLLPTLLGMAVLTFFLLLLIPATRKRWATLNLGCALIYASVYIEKGMGLIIPGLTPDPLGEIYVYTPSLTELLVAAGIFGVGFLVFTLMLKVAVPIMLGELTSAPGRPVSADHHS